MKKELIRFLLFISIVTLFLGVCFTSADFFTIPVAGVKDFLIVGAQWTMVMVALYLLCLCLASYRYLFAISLPVLTLASALLAWFRWTLNATLTPMILDAALANDWRTSGDLISAGLVGCVLLSLLIASGLVYYRWHSLKLRRPLIPFLCGALSLIGLMQIFTLRRPISERIPFTLYFSAVRYWQEKQIAQEERIDLTEGAHCEEEELTVVVVLGESLRPDYLGLNGYARNTTPLLSKERSLVSFPYIYTEQTYTNRSIPHLLTRADSSDYERAYTEQSFISLFRRCDYYTVWLANQEAANTYVYFMNECDSLFHVNMDKSSYVFDRWVDGDLLPLLDEALRVERPRKLIILHTIGSHWWYNSHFTDDYAQFQPIVRSKVISSCTQEEMINSYDNTILYTDYFLSEVMNRLRDRKAVLLYQSDHGEALGEEGVWLHAAETPYTHQAAGFVWLSSAYEEAHPTYLKILRRNASRPYRTDYLFHSVLDAGAVRSPYLDASLSVFDE